MKSFDLNVNVDFSDKKYCMIELVGFLDAHTVQIFEDRVDEILEEMGNHFLVINMQGLNYISSAGIGALMALTQRLRRKQGDLVLYKANDKVFKILDLLGFTKIFNLAGDEKDLDSFFPEDVQ